MKPLNDSPEILRSNRENLEITKDGTFCKLFDALPFELPVLEAYWGAYYKDRLKQSAILSAWAKVRSLPYLISIHTHPMRRQMLWNILVLLEKDMGLPYKSLNGRDGGTYESTRAAHLAEPKPPEQRDKFFIGSDM